MNFVGLFQALDTSQSINAKRDALIEFIRHADVLESAIAVQALTGRLEKKRLKPSLLKYTANQAFVETPWLFEECYATVGDLSETLAILFANPQAKPQTNAPILQQWIEHQARGARRTFGY